MKFLRFILLYLPVLFIETLYSQPSDINFHFITTKDGLNDDYISNIIQDKYGYMWFSSRGGLNRYNGKTVRRFTNVPGDSTSLPTGIVWSMASDAEGRLWIGFDFGLYEYDFIRNVFIKQNALKGIYIQQIVAGPNRILYLLTSRGLLAYQADKKTYIQMNSVDPIIKNNSKTILHLKENNLYIGSKNGYILYNIKSGKAEFLKIDSGKDFSPARIITDKQNNVWLCDNINFRLLKFSPALRQLSILSDDVVIKSTKKQTTFNDLICDSGGNIWITTAMTGLLQFNAQNGSLKYYFNDPQQQVAGSNAFLRCAYMSREGIVWLGSLEGVINFNPGQQLFSSVYPLPEGELNSLSRAMLEDKVGNLWFTTGNGISRYDPVSKRYTTWRNIPGRKDEIYFNSVRGITEDNNGTIWIATGKGINSYTPGETQLRFYSKKDSIPNAFYFSANTDSKGRVWLGTRDYDGLYCYTPHTGTFNSIKNLALFKQFTGIGAKIVFEDSKKRLWIGFNGSGLGMVDEVNGKTKHWSANDTTKNTIIGNNILDIKEDKNGVIWVSSFNGVTGIDLEKNKFTWLDDKTFFNTNYTGPLVVDQLNRLWIGTATGLYVTDEQRRPLGFFNESDGLIGSSFNEHSGYILRSGEVMMPTTKGFVKFSPEEYKPKPSSNRFYISWIEILNNRRYIPPEGVPSLQLKSNENYFTIGLEAINYINSSQTWYAYKLDDLEEDWHYTQDPKVVYSHVPGGDYVFRYKATTNVNDWNVIEKTLQIHIAIPFYKAKWFWILVGLLLAACIYLVYRFRIDKQRQLHELKTKAQMLEKEKTQVMYEGLKQQLNPHFLFNSLTSLSGLIETDQQMAGNFLKQMSKIYRYILKSRDSETVKLKEEIDFVQTYINLQKTRFKEGLQVNINVDEDSLHKKIPPVTLQNMVENAIKHNIIDNDSPLVIDIVTEGNYLVVKNNLQKKHVVETSNQQGLANLESLYRYLSNLPLIIEEDKKEFRIKIPLI